MMGGFNSGGHNRRHPSTVEATKRLSANLMQKHGVFADGRYVSWGWQDGDGNQTGSIWIAGGAEYVTLDFSVRTGDEPWRKIRQPVALDRIAKPFGGAQIYFTCGACGRRALHLFATTSIFKCRRCSGLVHGSSRERSPSRARRRAQTLRRHLGTDTDFEGAVRKPRWMRQRTFERIATEIHQKEAESWDDCLAALQRLKRIEARLSPRRRSTPRPTLRRRSSFW